LIDAVRRSQEAGNLSSESFTPFPENWWLEAASPSPAPYRGESSNEQLDIAVKNDTEGEGELGSLNKDTLRDLEYSSARRSGGEGTVLVAGAGHDINSSDPLESVGIVVQSSLEQFRTEGDKCSRAPDVRKAGTEDQEHQVHGEPNAAGGR
ncbi:hypothetical protein Moror_16698, partial [Moniliophthora roreri MCA 2997]